MAWEERILDISGEAGEDLRNDQFRFVVRDATTGKFRRPDSTTEIATGILQNAPEIGEAAVVRVAGYSKVQVNAVLAIGTYVKPEYVDDSDAGKAQNAAGELQCVCGLVVEASNAEDDLATVMLVGPNPQRETISVPIGQFTANQTANFPLLSVCRSLKVTKIAVSCEVLPSDADGTCLLKVVNHDKSASANDDLTGSADCEALTGNETMDIALTAPSVDLICEAGDRIFVALTNNSEALDTNWTGAIVSLEFDYL